MSEQLRSIFARWQTLEAEKAATSNDLKELFIEAKHADFDPKALRIAFRAKVKADEPESDADRATKALVEGYLDMLDEKPPARRMPARVEIINEISPDHGKAPRGLKLAEAVGKQSQPNEGGGHVVPHDAQEYEKGAAGEGLNAVPVDPAAARIPEEDVPTYLQRGHPDNAWAEPAPSHIREAGART